MTVKEAIRLVTIDEDGKKKLNIADVTEVFRRQRDRCVDAEFRYAMLNNIYPIPEILHVDALTVGTSIWTAPLKLHKPKRRARPGGNRKGKG